MKTALFLPFALLLGLIIGGWAPKEELRAVRKELSSVKAKPGDHAQSLRFDALTRIVQIPDRANNQRKRSAQPVHTALVSAAPPSATNAGARLPVSSAAASNTQNKVSEPLKEPPKPEDLRARIDEAKELWATRVEVARAQWAQRLKLSQSETTQFDSAITAMNENLYAAMQNFADVVAATDALTPEAGVRAFNEMTSVLVQTYDELNAIVPPEQLSDAAKIELTDFIDPAIAEPLIAVQDKIDNMPRTHSRGVGLNR